MANKRLAVIEVDGKQRWIFETNRLRDAVGASFLVAEVGEEAKRQARSCGGHLIVAASGLARAIFADAPSARGWITAITGRFAREAPGMEVLGAEVEIAGDSLQDLDAATRRAYDALTTTRAALGGPQLIERTLPWTLPCHYSGLPAVNVQNPVGPEHKAGRRVSAGVLARREVFGQSRDRVCAALKDYAGLDERVITRINDAIVASYKPLDPTDDTTPEPLSDRESWRGVVHIDANGLGRIFLNFGKIALGLNLNTIAEYTARIQAFSKAINRAAWRAVALAIDDVLTHSGSLQRLVPIYPLVVGGDDITLVTDGRWSLFLARRVLHHWEAETAAPEIRGVLAIAHNLTLSACDSHLPACGGVSIVKHHFPFSIAYVLSSDLCDNAKDSFRPKGISGLDWHAVTDPSPPLLRALRGRTQVGRDHVTRRPYTIADTPDFANFDDLCAAARVLAQKDDEGRFVLPRAQLNKLREGMLIGRAEAESRLKLSRLEKALKPVFTTLHGANALYLADPPDPAVPPVPDAPLVHRSGLLDAYDHIELMEGLTR